MSAHAAAEDEERNAAVYQYLMGFSTAPGRLGVDIGGTTGKVVYVQNHTDDTHVTTMEDFGLTGRRHIELETHCPALGGRLHCIKFATERVAPILKGLIHKKHEEEEEKGVESNVERRSVCATGGGVHKFGGLMFKALGFSLEHVPEFDSLVEGVRTLTQLPGAVYTIAADKRHEEIVFDAERDFPCLVCNIGSGTFMMWMSSDDAKKVGGTSIGGSTFLGLVNQMTGAQDFDHAMELVSHGDASKVDLTIRDIYGETGIPPQFKGNEDLTASSFGKLSRRHAPVDPPPQDADIAVSVCRLVTQSIALYACTLARSMPETNSVIFTGGFLNGNELAQQKLADFVHLENCRSGTHMRPLYLRHAEFAGAIGCISRILHSQPSSPNLGPQPDGPAA
eukprot:TRINITY_DN16740_c0_g1_i1.p1 TRINITY_DN16740_c0_g1~~TRINITY_DN16740_c0_g1_i1.p1  ORF type:complete len:394 (-),score=58.15 TRINITY_DN16740_c0_g1_i1:138-1319(-)